MKKIQNIQPYILFIINILAMFFLASCENVNTDNIIKDEITSIMLGNNSSNDEIRSDLFFPNTLPSDSNTRLSYISSNKDIIDDSGNVNAPIEIGVSVTITVDVLNDNPFLFNVTYYVLPKILRLQLSVEINTFNYYQHVMTFESTYFDLYHFDQFILPEGYEISHFIDSKSNTQYELSDKLTQDLELIIITKLKSYVVKLQDDDVSYEFSYTYMDIFDQSITTSKEGYQFIGWFYENEVGHDVELISHQTHITQNIHAFALWIKN